MKICIWKLSPSSLDQTKQDALIASLPFGREEQERLRTLKHPEQRQRSLCALLALRALVGKSDKDFTICREADGKPYFSKHPELFFSLTHTNTLCAAALSEGEGAIGLDMEPLLQDRRLEIIAARFFLPEEQDAFRNAEDPTLCFYRFWTQKEAIAKQSGKGLAVHFAAKSFPPRPTRHIKITHGKTKAVLCVVSETPMRQLSVLTAPKSIGWQEI